MFRCTPCPFCTIKTGNYVVAFAEIISFITFFIISCTIWAEFDIKLKKLNDDNRQNGIEEEDRSEVHALFVCGSVTYFICIISATVLLVGITRDDIKMLGIWMAVRIVICFCNIAVMVVTKMWSGFRRPVDFDSISLASAPYFIWIVGTNIHEIRKSPRVISPRGMRLKNTL